MIHGERIKELRKNINLTLEKFGERIGVTRSAISNIENGNRNLTEQVIKTICLQSWDGQYVNENWLRYGEGEMFLALPPEDEVAAAVSNVLEDLKCENSLYTLIKEALLKYEKLDQDSKNKLGKYIDDVIEGYSKKREDK